MKTVGSRAQVYHGTASRTSGGLTKKDLFKNKHGRYVSLKKHKQSKNPDTNPLLKQKLLQNKGSKTFGPKESKSKSKSKGLKFSNILNKIFS